MTDTSHEYIAMCDCPEIQGAWEPKRGDYTMFKINRLIFLPDQRWYQEQLGWTPANFREETENGTTFFIDEPASWEQLYCHIYMNVVHNKRWEAGKWVTV